MKKNSEKATFFGDRRIIFIISLVLAFVVWVMVAGFIDPGTSYPIRNVPIDYARNEAKFQERNLMVVIPPLEKYADVQVTGDGAVLGLLSSSSVTVYADYGLITEAGTFDVPLRAAKIDPGNWDILELSTTSGANSLEKPARMVTMTFEQVEAKTMPVTIKADNITASAGFFTDSPIASPETVVLRGPKSKVDLVHQVVAQLMETEELDDEKNYMGVALVLQDAKGQTIDAKAAGITYTPEFVEVEVGILVMRDIALKAEFSGLPGYFDTKWFYENVHLSVEELQMIGPAKAFETISNTYTVATFDISQLSMGWESPPVTIKTPEGSGLRITDEQRQVEISLNTSNMAEKTFEVPIGESNVVNGATNASIAPVAELITVRLMGPQEQINALLPENITVQIDAFGISAARSGQQNIPARILVPGANRCLPIGGYSILCNVQQNT